MQTILFAAFICLAVALPQGRQIEHLDHPDKIPGEFLIMLHATTGDETNEQYTNSVAERIAAISPKINIVQSLTNLKNPVLFVKTSDEMVMNQLFQLDEVYIIETNRHIWLNQACSTQNTQSHEWSLTRIATRDKPVNYDNGIYRFRSNDGGGVGIYVVDTGVRLTHDEYRGRAFFGTNTIGGSDDDEHGHGTHCAGIAAGSKAGIARNAAVISVKAFDQSLQGTVQSVLAALQWVSYHVKLTGWRAVVSASFAGSGDDRVLNQYVQTLVAEGIVVVVAAGNDFKDACYYSPALVPTAITVGATDNNDNLASFSNHGTCVDILAPGVDIVSASNTADNIYRLYSGTSQACPFVAGLAAKYLADNPAATPAQVENYLTSVATQNRINLGGTMTPNLLLYHNCV